MLEQENVRNSPNLNRTFYKIYDTIPLIIFTKNGIIEKISDVEAVI